MILALCVNAAIAGDFGTVEVLGGVRGNTESNVDQPSGRPLASLEPSGTAAVLGQVRHSWNSGPWIGLAGEVWTYFPEPDTTHVRLTSQAGASITFGKSGHLDAAGRFAWEAFPVRHALDSVRSEGDLSTGLDVRVHHLDLVGAVVSRTYGGTPAWSFTTGEVGLAWRVEPASWRVNVRVSGEFNRGFTTIAGGTLAPATGQQLRVAAGAGWTSRAWNVDVEYRMYLAGEGQVSDAVRPQFTPIGEYDDDADALSAGGFTQHRASLDVTGRVADHWTLAFDALARLRDNEAGQVISAFSRSLHVSADVGRDLGRGFSLHAVGGVNVIDGADGGGALDPYGWLALQWKNPPPK